LVIESVDLVNNKISCYGWWPNAHPGFGSTNATIFDYHIASGSSAVDFGDTGHLPLDVCDLDNDTSNPDQKLPQDLDGNVREQGNPPTPDSGAYETGGM